MPPSRHGVSTCAASRAASVPPSSRDFFRGLIFKNHVYSAEETDLVLPCSKTYRLDEKFVDTAKNQPLKVRSAPAGRQAAVEAREQPGKGPGLASRPTRTFQTYFEEASPRIIFLDFVGLSSQNLY